MFKQAFRRSGTKQKIELFSLVSDIQHTYFLISNYFIQKKFHQHNFLNVLFLTKIKLLVSHENNNLKSLKTLQ